MGITFRHDAAGVVPSGNPSGRKYGQQLVMQQQKYARDSLERTKDRMYDTQRQAMQNQFNLNRDAARVEADKQRQKMAARMAGKQLEARADLERQEFNRRRRAQMEDMEAARNREQIERGGAELVSMARNALEAGRIPDDLIPEFRAAIADRARIMGSRIDAAQKVEALEQAENNIANILRQAKAPISIEEQVRQATTPYQGADGNMYRRTRDGEFERIEPTEQPPMTAAQAFQGDTGVMKDYMGLALNDLQRGDELTAPSFEDQYNRAMEIYGIVNGMNQQQPTVPAVQPPAQQWTPDRFSQAMGGMTSQQQNAPAANQASQQSQSRAPVVQAPATSQYPASQVPQDSGSNPWAGAINPEDLAQPSMGSGSGVASSPLASILDTPTPQPSMPMSQSPAPAGQYSPGLPEGSYSPAKITKIDWDTPTKGTTAAVDSAMVQELRNVIGDEAPETVANAVSTLLDSTAPREDRKQANQLLYMAGYDLAKLLSNRDKQKTAAKKKSEPFYMGAGRGF